MNDTSAAIEAINVVILTLQTLITIGAVYFAWQAYVQTKEIHKSQQRLTEKIHKEQLQLAKQQIFYQLVEQLGQIRSIDPTNPHWGDVSMSANKLELIASIWKDELTSLKTIETNYRSVFMQVFKEIYQSRDLQTGEERGKKILERDCPAAMRLYKVWNRETDQSNLLTAENQGG
jgi:hypothetical protein